MHKSPLYNSVTHDISVSVESMFQPEVSAEGKGSNIFSYKVTIINLSKRKVQLLYRKWQILDLLVGWHKVEGEGVVGEQPEIEPEESYMYSSWCPITSEVGFMKGTYIFMDTETKERFEVGIPTFELIIGELKN